MTASRSWTRLISSNSKGFSLIELMIVVVIIGVLANIAALKLNHMMGRSRDKLRRHILSDMKTVIETYHADHGAYPDSTLIFDGWLSSENPGNSVNPVIYMSLPNNWVPGVAPEYYKRLPHDPKGGPPMSQCGGLWASEFLYASDRGGHDYALIAHCSIEETAMDDPKDPYYDPVRGNHAWKIYSPGAAAW